MTNTKSKIANAKHVHSSSSQRKNASSSATMTQPRTSVNEPFIFVNRQRTNEIENIDPKTSSGHSIIQKQCHLPSASARQVCSIECYKTEVWVVTSFFFSLEENMGRCSCIEKKRCERNPRKFQNIFISIGRSRQALIFRGKDFFVGMHTPNDDEV